MTPYEVPITPGTPQTFAISLNGVVYQLTLNFCTDNQTWTLNIAAQDNTPIANGIPLVTGADLLAQYEYLGIGGSLFVQTDGNPYAVPGFTALGDTGHLYFTTEP